MPTHILDRIRGCNSARSPISRQIMASDNRTGATYLIYDDGVGLEQSSQHCRRFPGRKLSLRVPGSSRWRPLRGLWPLRRIGPARVVHAPGMRSRDHETSELDVLGCAFSERLLVHCVPSAQKRPLACVQRLLAPCRSSAAYRVPHGHCFRRRPTETLDKVVRRCLVARAQ
jgi:hypothetical protein